jgi:hypothetical protein
MKLTRYLLLSFLFFFTFCSEREEYNNSTGPGILGAFTEIKGKISGELISKDSPYKVVEDIVVDSGTTLKINGGVNVYFTENKKLIVYGELIVDGNYYQMIKLEQFDTTKSWQGIHIINADKPALIDYTYIKGIRKEYDSVYSPSSISVKNSELTITHSVIYKNSAAHGGAIGVEGGSLKIINNVIRDNSADFLGGAIISESSDLKIINNTFYNNYSNNAVGGVLVYYPTVTELQNNIFYKNSSRSGQPHFNYSSQDSTNFTESYNYFAFGTMDPIFLDQFYLTLYYTSPCRDSGNPDPLFDDYNETRNDQGAYGGPGGNWY